MEKIFSSILKPEEKKIAEDLFESIKILTAFQIKYIVDMLRKEYNISEQSTLSSISSSETKTENKDVAEPANFSVFISKAPSSGLPRFYLAVREFMSKHGKELSLMQIKELLSPLLLDNSKGAEILTGVPAEHANKFKKDLKEQFDVSVELK